MAVIMPNIMSGLMAETVATCVVMFFANSLWLVVLHMRRMTSLSIFPRLLFRIWLTLTVHFDNLGQFCP